MPARRRPQLERLEERCVLSSSAAAAMDLLPSAVAISLAPGDSAVVFESAVAVGTQVTVTARVTLAYAGSYNVVTNWGDAPAGTAPDTSTSPLVPSNSSTTKHSATAPTTFTIVATTHTYPAGGTYTITLSLAEKPEVTPASGPAETGSNDSPVLPIPSAGPEPGIGQSNLGQGNLGGNQAKPGIPAHGPEQPGAALILELQRSGSRTHDVMSWMRLADPRPLLTGVGNAQSNSSTGSASMVAIEEKPAPEPAVFQQAGYAFIGSGESGTSGETAKRENTTYVAAPAQRNIRTNLAASTSRDIWTRHDEPGDLPVTLDEQERLAVFATLLQKGIEHDDTECDVTAADAYFAQARSTAEDQNRTRGHGGDLLLLLVALAAAAPTGTERISRHSSAGDRY
jgi:hypothetical protein